MIAYSPAIFAGVLSFTLVALLSEVVRRAAIRYGLLDQPGGNRRHIQATPHLGGVAIVSGTLCAFLLVDHVGRQMIVLIGAATVIFLLGLIDDLRPLSPAIRLTTECLAASALVEVGVHSDLLSNAGYFGHSIDAVGTVAWIVILTNSFNLLDNMDGVAAAIALVTSPLLALLALATGRVALAGLLIAVAAGCAGFLVHNWAPAQIFMGDSGSLFLGFLVAASAVLTCTDGQADANTSTIAAACALFLMTFVAVVDTCTVIVSRLRAGRRWTQGGTDHISHRLHAVGLSSSRTAISLSATAAITGILGLIVISGLVPAVAALAITAAVGVTVVALAQRVAVYGGVTPIMADGSEEQVRTAQTVGHPTG